MPIEEVNERRIEMELFFKNLGYKIEQAVKKDVQRILTEIGDERIYSVALVTDSDCITLFLAINTYEYMEKEDKKQMEELSEGGYSEEEIKDISKHSISLTKWIPDEWGYSDGKNSELVEISKLLFEKGISNPKEYEKHTDLFLETVTLAFQHVIESKIFGERSEEITYFISMSDDDRTPEIEDHSAQLLSSENVYKKFHEETLRESEFWSKIIEVRS